MGNYLIVKSILMVLVLAAGFGIFSARVRRLFRIMRAVRGKANIQVDRIGERIKVLFIDVLGQSNVRRKWIPGLGHTLIFFGFLAVQPHSLELMIKGVFPPFGIEYWVPGLYGAYLFVADLLAFLVLFGLAYALYRRMFIKPKYLKDGLDARLIILFTAVIIITFYFINAFQIWLPAESNVFNYAEYFIVSETISKIFALSSASTTSLRIGYEIFYWIHIITIIGFLIYIPGSKHLHLLAAVPNVFLKPLETPKVINKTDIEDETAESFGLGKVSELNWKNILDLYACTEFGRCEEQCPANITGKPLSPNEVIHDIKRDLFYQADKLLSHDVNNIEPIVRETSPVSSDVIWSCTSCRACENICPVNIQHLDIIFEIRKYQVLMEASFPPELQETFANLENQANPWGFSSDTRADWCKSMDVQLMTDHPDADILYFVGCTGSFDDRGKQITKAIVNVLKKADVDFAILGAEERCNGDMARRAGNEYLAQMMIQQNIETLNQYKPKKILAGCPHCFNILKNEYPQFGAKYRIVHHVEFFLDLIKQDRLRPNGSTSEKISFHDSCYLGRWNGLFETPRELLRSVGIGQNYIEMQRTKSEGLCCGAGGARMFMEEKLGKRINIERAEEIIAAGVSSVVAACPYCITMLRDGIADLNGNIAVRDIAELIDEVTS